MDSVIRALLIYGFLLIVFRVSGKRNLKKLTVFDFVLFLMIAETTEQALIGEDHSIGNGLVLICTLIGADIALSLVKQRFSKVKDLLESKPTVIVKDGQMLRERADKERINESVVLEAGRTLHGLQRLEQIKYAILEKDGSISIIPQAKKAS